MAKTAPPIIIDTREQKPYDFGEGVPVIRRGLPAGDYSLDGFEERIALERKALADFVKTITAGRKRFSKELKKLQNYDFACILIESSPSEILRAEYRSQITPQVVLRSAMSFTHDYGIPVWFCETRQAGIRFARSWLGFAWKRCEKCRK